VKKDKRTEEGRGGRRREERGGWEEREGGERAAGKSYNAS
jgi:hypothetical protein